LLVFSGCDAVVHVRTVSEHIGAGETASRRWSLERFDGWYDLIVSAAYDTAFACETAGHLETGDDSISDPGWGLL